jgi:hypothetical protein
MRAEHGTRARYNSGCRCERCCDASRVYERNRRRRMGKPERPERRWPIGACFERPGVDWEEHANCKGMSWRLFFEPERYVRAIDQRIRRVRVDEREVMLLCEACEVKGPCLEAALWEEREGGIRFGIRGGRTAEDRVVIHRDRVSAADRAYEESDDRRFG